MNRKRISTRGLISILAFFSFAVLAVTGIVLYIVPQGRIAYWVVWDFLSLTKNDWENIHVLFGLLFLVTAVFHVVLNWKPLVNYVLDKSRKALNMKWELAVSVVLTLLFILSALLLLPPLRYVIDVGQAAKDAWIVSEDYEPPFGHAELVSLKTLCSRMNIPLEAALGELGSRGVEMGSPKEIIKDIAEANHITPMQLYSYIKKHQRQIEPENSTSFTPEEVEAKFTGIGLGKETLPGACERTGVDPTTAIERLRLRGIVFEEGEELKEAAERYDLEVADVLKIMLIE